MNKAKLMAKILEKLEEERAALAQAALHTYEAATHEESEAEDQYDTRGLEASYLAGAQAKRVAELEQLLHTLKHLAARTFKESDPIAATALVEIAGEGKNTWCFLLPMGGGSSIDFDSHHIQIITPKSPLGEALVGRKVGDEIVVDIGRETREYQIVKVV